MNVTNLEIKNPGCNATGIYSGMSAVVNYLSAITICFVSTILPSTFSE